MFQTTEENNYFWRVSEQSFVKFYTQGNDAVNNIVKHKSLQCIKFKLCNNVQTAR